MIKKNIIFMFSNFIGLIFSGYTFADNLGTLTFNNQNLPAISINCSGKGIGTITTSNPLTISYTDFIQQVGEYPRCNFLESANNKSIGDVTFKFGSSNQGKITQAKSENGYSQLIKVDSDIQYPPTHMGTQLSLTLLQN